MTIAAYWEKQPQNGGNQRAERRKLHLETCGSANGKGKTQVVVHNISTSGLLIESPLQLDHGETIEIDLPHAGPTGAIVIWSGKGYFGCQFEEPISTATLSAAQLQGHPASPRAIETTSPPADLASEPFGMRLQRLRKAKGITLMQVATAVGVSKPTVWAWEQERSRPTRERYELLAQALGVTPADLTPDKNDRALQKMLDRFKQLIAHSVGTSPEKVKILLEL